MSDLLGQRIDIMFVDIQVVRAYVESGQVRYLAATTPNRVAVTPNVPTLVESGYPSVVTDASVILFAPAKTPQPILERLNAAMIKVVSGSAARERLMGIGHEPTTMTLPELDSFVRTELTKWRDMISSVGLAKQ
jgi:tripartite-type tricarboxylate transporter receptor subunit TctC